jgi:hypothetical protein
LFNRSDHHTVVAEHLEIASPQWVFHFGNDSSTTTYEGVASVRGMTCNTWTRRGNWTSRRSGNVVTFVADHYFAVANWMGVGGPMRNSPVPVRTTVVGNRTHNGTFVSPVRFEYEYVHFWEGSPPAEEFSTGAYTMFSQA